MALAFSHFSLDQASKKPTTKFTPTCENGWEIKIIPLPFAQSNWARFEYPFLSPRPQRLFIAGARASITRTQREFTALLLDHKRSLMGVRGCCDSLASEFLFGNFSQLIFNPERLEGKQIVVLIGHNTLRMLVKGLLKKFMVIAFYVL